MQDVTLFPQSMLPLYIFEPRYRRMLKDSSGIGVVMAEDRKFVDKAFIGSLQQAWEDSELDHFDRSLPLYREKADSLRSLATYSCN